jgi:hypothetical protein
MSALDLAGMLGDMLTTQAPLTRDQKAALQRYGGYQLLLSDNDTMNSPVSEARGRTSRPPSRQASSPAVDLSRRQLPEWRLTRRRDYSG